MIDVDRAHDSRQAVGDAQVVIELARGHVAHVADRLELADGLGEPVEATELEHLAHQLIGDLIPPLVALRHRHIVHDEDHRPAADGPVVAALTLLEAAVQRVVKHLRGCHRRECKHPRLRAVGLAALVAVVPDDGRLAGAGRPDDVGDLPGAQHQVDQVPTSRFLWRPHRDGRKVPTSGGRRRR